MTKSAKELVDGKWNKVLVYAGLDPEFLTYTRKEGPCPLCGGTTRFRFYDIETGKHFCNKCGMAQSGWRILRVLTGIDDPLKLSDWVRYEWAGIEKVEMPAYVANTVSRDGSDESTWPALLEKYAKAWASAKRITNDTPAWRYLERRCPGIKSAPEVLRSTTLDYWVPNEPDVVEKTGRAFTNVGTFPGMLALVQGSNGEMVNLWRWYLTADGAKAAVPVAKKAAGAFGTKGAYAVRLAEPVDHLAISEGVETAESVMLMKGVPSWATLSKVGMERFQLPQGYERVKRIDFYGDNDAADQHGRRAGNEAARKARDRMKALGLKSSIYLPASTSYDFADINSGAAASMA